MNLKKIAELAGVSTATVSNVINKNYHTRSTEGRSRSAANTGVYGAQGFRKTD